MLPSNQRNVSNQPKMSAAQINEMKAKGFAEFGQLVDKHGLPTAMQMLGSRATKAEFEKHYTAEAQGYILDGMMGCMSNYLREAVSTRAK